MTSGCINPFQPCRTLTIKIPCKTDKYRLPPQQLGSFTVHYKEGLNGKILTGAIFFRSFWNSCASYLPAGRVAFSVGLQQQSSHESLRQKVCTADGYTAKNNRASLLARSLDLKFYGLLISALLNGLVNKEQEPSNNANRSHKCKPDVRQVQILPKPVVSQHGDCIEHPIHVNKRSTNRHVAA